MVSIAELLAGMAAAEADRAERRARKPTKTAKDKFRSSIAWRRARFAVLAENAKRNGGRARCELCGAEGKPGAALHVDHVVAVSRDWSRRLDRTNLQVLCPDCNIGKLDGPAADFRKEP